jgi:cellulase (glycosyl hydrolase family 5)
MYHRPSPRSSFGERANYGTPANRSTQRVPGAARRTAVSAYRFLLLLLAILSIFPTLFSAQSSGAAGVFVPAPQEFASGAFDAVWTRTDSLVASGNVQRTWLWGPQPDGPGLMEDYAEGAGGKRLVQYFDKSRMEINDPNADPSSPFYVTNGLLTVELISGRMQVGDNTFVQRKPSQTNMTGDPGDLLSPTYADMAGVSNASGARPDPDRTGQAVTATLSRGGQVGDDPTKASTPGTTMAFYEKSTGHNIPQVMWDFLNSSGQVSVNGVLTDSKLIDPWFYASGLPISDAYWVKATIAGQPTDVLLQAYERRVLTYVPSNPDGFKVEVGNIGQHYYDWRYKTNSDLIPTPAPAPTQPAPTPAPSGPATISRFAIDVVQDTSAATLDSVKVAGAGAVRVKVAWDTVEPLRTKGGAAQYNWAYTDGIYQALSDRGLQPITLIESCPVWACTRPSGPVRDGNLSDFVDFMTAMVARYSKAPYNAHFWEFWNEPDSVGDAVPGTSKYYGWGSNADRYVQMLKAIRPGVKEADPQAMMVLGGLAYDGFQDEGGVFNRHFLDNVLDMGGGQYLDALNFHYYPNNLHWCSFSDKLNELRGKMQARGLNLPFISTETGLSNDSAAGSSNDIQSLYVVQAYAQSVGERMLSTSWFVVRDFAYDGSAFTKYGLFDASGAAKPAATAYRLAVTMIGQRPAVRSLNSTDGLSGAMHGYEFGSDTQHQNNLWVLWAWDENSSGHCGAAPAPTTFTIPSAMAPNLLSISNIYGKAIAPTSRPDGSLVFPLDSKPVYLQWEK